MLRTVAVLVALLPAVALADMTGQAAVIDGDTIEIHGQRIRLHGIDAPELAQICWHENGEYPCGRISKKNTNLWTQRDLVRPKLVLGEIDVSEANDTVQEAAE